LRQDSLNEGKTHLIAAGEVVLAAAIWATSFVAIKYGLASLGPLTLAGLRFFLAFLMLVPVLMAKGLPLAPRRWRRLAVMGLVQYTIGNGALFSSLKGLSSTAGSLLYCFIPLLTAGLEVVWIKERISAPQLLGVMLVVGGSVRFFIPEITDGASLGHVALLGLAAVSVATFSVMVRGLARTGEVDSLSLTAFPLGFGGAGLLVLGIAVEGLPSPTPVAWGVIVGMAGVNTVTAFLLYTHALRHLKATEASVILNLSPIATALIARSTLGEVIQPGRMIALVVIVAGAILAQWRPRAKRSTTRT